MASQMKIFSVGDAAFRKYGRIVKGFDWKELLQELQKTPCPKDGTVYVASDGELEKLDAFAWLRDAGFGGLPIELGYCNGVNHALNALEYHRSSEINVAADDLILLLGALQDIDPETFTYDTSHVEAFLVPAGTAVEMFATTLHFAPCSVNGGGFRDAVALPRGTNGELTAKPAGQLEAKLLFAVNKWLVAHPESGLQKDGAFVGLTGENITLE